MDIAKKMIPIVDTTGGTYDATGTTSLSNGYVSPYSTYVTDGNQQVLGDLIK